MRLLVDRGLERLEELTGVQHGLWRSGWGRKSTIVKCDGITLVLVGLSGYRPPQSRLIGVEPILGRVLLPSEISKDLLEVGHALGIPRHKLGSTCALVNWDFGLVNKDSEPVLVDSQEVAKKLDIERSFERTAAAFPGRTIWWQRWGGTIHALCLDGERLAYDLVDTLAGKCEVPLLR